MGARMRNLRAMSVHKRVFAHVVSHEASAVRRRISPDASQLCNENYLWQWRSFLNTGSAGLFLFGYRSRSIRPRVREFRAPRALHHVPHV